MTNTTHAHTPGPWKVRTAYSNGEPVCYTIHLGQTSIADITSLSEQDRVNAALIAAAPAMYEALVETMKVLRSLRDNKEEWYTLVTPELLTAWDKNKAALAQAEGR